MKTELHRARAFTDSLFKIVAAETLYERPIPARHRLIFYVGHLDAFDWNQLPRGVLGKPSFNRAFDTLFEAGIDPAPGQSPQDTPSDWPTLDVVQSYVAQTRTAVDEVWDRVPAEMQQMVIEHRWMHAETICYLLHQLDPAQKRRVLPAPHVVSTGAPSARFVEIAAGETRLGQRNDEFGWDNEFPAHLQEVPAFEISKHKVTNGEYLRFVEEGGPAPLFWQRNDSWRLRRMFDQVALPLDAPVYATYEQASSYAQWAGAALPTEAEWHRAAYRNDQQAYPWGNDAPNGVHGNFDFANWDPVSVSAYPAGNSADGVSQMIGNGWEWTSTPFKGFDGFEARPYYPGYSANFFDDQHYVLKGGSPVTSRKLLRRSFRNWFRADYPYVYSTIRLVRR
ncbi:MAG TPA: SUMF1/EgtB/PvdO family nonheme iron enzyme [Burkholderiaceae bacterium]|nr:SUMF1/EgtB/PvdO family nonheme iron enzyme [Burkholderiaceae bacterium]